MLRSRKPDAAGSFVMYLGLGTWCHKSTFRCWDENRGPVLLFVSVLKGGNGILLYYMDSSDAGNDPAHVENMALASE